MSSDLREVHGDIRVTRPGAVLADLAVHGTLSVEAANVTVRNCLVRGAAPTQGHAA